MDYECAYKAIPYGEGVILLFDGITVDHDFMEPEIKINEGQVYLVVGTVAIRMTPELIRELHEGPRLLFARCSKDAYEPEALVGGLKLSPLFIAKMEGVLEFAAAPLPS